MATGPAIDDKAAQKLTRFARPRREAFLAALAETANVSAAARAASVSTSIAYRHRRQNALFRDQWHGALSEGYVRLEAELLAEALRKPNSRTTDTTLKLKSLRTRLGLALLSLHRATVRGERASEAQVRGQNERPEDVRARLEARLATMHDRMRDEPGADV